MEVTEVSPDYRIMMLFAIGTAGMLVLAGAIVLFVTFYQKKMIQQQLRQQVLEGEYQKKILQATLESQERERNSVASDLHDNIGGMLSAIRMGLAAIGKQMPDQHKLDPQKQMLDDTIDAVRKISRDLMPATLEKFGLINAVRELCDRMQSATSIQISLVEIGSNQPLDKKRELMIYRIVQELLNNAIKHAKATFIEIVFNYTGDFQLTVEDNGIGFSSDEMERSGKKSLGLFNIQSRVQMLGASLVLDKEKKKGSKIIVNVPYGTPES